jgi:tetratricopeptide (TPR) repeat protein
MRNFLFFILLIASAGFVHAQQKTDEQSKGNLYFSEKDYQAAADCYSKVIAENKRDKSVLSVIYFYRAECYRFLNQYEKSLKDYTKAISLNPQYRDAYWNRALLSEVNNNFTGAIADYRKVSTLIPQTDTTNQSILYANLAEVQARRQNIDSALTADSISLVFSPHYSRAYYMRGELHRELKNDPQAIIDFTNAINNYTGDDPKPVSMWYTVMADTKSADKQYKDAINDYSLALKLDPGNGVAYWNRGAAYHYHQDYELAARDYTKAMAYYKDSPKELSKLYDDRATNEMGQSLLADAIKDDSTALVLDPNDQSACFDLADAYTQNGDYQAGIDKYRAALGFEKHNKTLNSELYFLIANNEYFLKEFDKVIADCTMAIAINPANSSAYYYRGKIYLKQDGKKDLAMNDFNKVIELDTSHQTVNYIFSLFYIGNGGEAARILQQQVVNTTDNAMILSDYYNLACLYSLMNNPAEANSYLKIAIDRGYAKKYAVADDDLDNIRNTADYKSIIGDGK